MLGARAAKDRFLQKVFHSFCSSDNVTLNAKSCIQEKSQILDCADRLNAMVFGEVRDVTAHA